MERIRMEFMEETGHVVGPLCHAIGIATYPAP